MTNNSRRLVLEKVILDLNTQCDFLLPGGALPVANRGDLMPRIRQIMNWARLNLTPVISSLEAHRPSESFKGLPPHCLDHTLGQKKLPFTLMPTRILLMGDNTSDLPLDPFRKYQQVIFTKRNADFLSNPKADRLINGIAPNYWIIFGVTATHCVKSVALGLLARHQKVVVVRDACGFWSSADGEHAFRQIEAKGALLVSTDEIVSDAAAERIRSYTLPVSVEQEDEDPLVVAAQARQIADGAETIGAAAGDAANGNGHSGKNGNGHSGTNGNGNGKAAAESEDSRAASVPQNGARRKKQTEATPKNIADFVPKHLIRRKSGSANQPTKSRRGLA